MINFIEPVDIGRKLPGTSGVYGLLDPLTHRVRYVGSSQNIQARYYAHLHSTSRFRTPKENWIRGLRLVGAKPLCSLLEQIQIDKDRDTRHTVESVWIERFHLVGDADLNLQMHPTNTSSQHKQLLAENRRLKHLLKELEAKVRKYEGLGYDLV